METTAVYSEKENHFVINTNTVNGQKFWITNGAYYATFAIVFAQTVVKGKNEGISPFIVRMRDDNGKLCDGVVIDDMGHKMGLNGVDNARIILKNVKVNKDDLLNRISDIDEKGNFISKVAGRRQRFLAAADRLLSGRLCIGSMMISMTKLCLLITSKYGSVRLSNGKTGKSDAPINSFQLFQNQIVPLITKTYIYNLGLLSIRKVYSDYMINQNKYDENYFKNLIRLVCVIKPMIAWHANTTGNICRERCGGQGFLSINRLDGCIYGAHSAITAEGDSSVLMQKVSKEYVEDYMKQVIKAPQFNTLNVNKNSICDYDSLINLIKLREAVLLGDLSEKTMNNLSNIYETWMLKESDTIQDIAMMFGERYCLEEAHNNYGNKEYLSFNLVKLWMK
jgi:acyl-CoA oxidase